MQLLIILGFTSLTLVYCVPMVIIAKDNQDKVLIECENCKLFFGIEVENGTELIEDWKATFDSVGEAREAWNRRVKNLYCVPL